MKTVIRILRHASAAAIGCAVIAVGVLSVSGTIAVLTPALAQVSAEFQSALEPYGSWQPHPRFGEVWVPYDLPPGWRPYTYGRWVYTDEWGWYWVSDDEEADWGWVTFHYGRWAHDRRLGWFWVPGDEWGPAWVDWRRGDDYVGWAPLPPDEIIYEYDNDPAYWVFLPPRYLIAPRFRTYFLPPQRTVVVFRRTVIVNRTVRLEHRDRRARFAVNPGIAPGIVAAAARRPVQTFRVQPRVLAGTQGVAGAVQVRPQDLSRGSQRYQRGQPRPSGSSPVQATVQPTQTVVQPLARVPQAQPLGSGEHGRLGPTPPRAAQGATVAPAPAPKAAPAPQPGIAPQQPNGPTPPVAPTPRVTPPAATPATPPQTTPPAVSPQTSPPPAASPRTLPPPATPPGATAPRPGLERREGGPPPGAGGPSSQQPTVVRPIPPQSAPPQPPEQLRRPAPPVSAPPPQVQPPQPQPQRQVQPPPQPQRQMQPPPQPRQVQPPPQQRPAPPAPAQQQKKPPPKPGEKPPEQPK
ncbi:MAG TPA: DUF6600 domain-containing protein [Pseudolabrys sp.]|nr:DUF6600 domain-containing protein [Pseudolabrys sp.]